MTRHTSMLTHVRLVAGFLAITGAATAAPIINIFPSVGPDYDVAATFAQYSNNALFAIQNGLSSQGTAGTPSYYGRTSAISSKDIISTYDGFESWRSQTPPPAGYEGQYGNMLYWGVSISGNGERFSLSNVTYSDAFFGNTATIGLGSIGFGNRAIGISFGADRIQGTADDQILTGAASVDAQMDLLYFSGIGVAWVVDDPALLGYYLNEIRRADYAFVRGSYVVNTTFGPTIGSGTVELQDAVPEPATFGLVGAGLLALAYAARRWKR